MLHNGKFIKEDPPRIGAYYVPKFRLEEYTPEERFVQDLMLEYQNESKSFFSKFLGIMLRI